LIKKLLLNQSAEQFSDSMGEVTKIAMIDGDLLWKKVCNLDNSREKLWKILPLLIKAKNKVVKKDPFEKSGHRYILNLGHTLGHALELSSKISHGRAVALGLRAAIDFSADQKILKSTEIKKISHDCIPSSEDLAAVLRSNKSWQDLLLSDKKRTGAAAVNYVFIKKIGLPVVKKIPVSEFLDFCQKNYL
jgi:3-dehydroquinate synthase